MIMESMGISVRVPMKESYARMFDEMEAIALYYMPNTRLFYRHVR